MDRRRGGSTAGSSDGLLFQAGDSIHGRDGGAATLMLDRRSLPAPQPRLRWPAALRAIRDALADLDLVVDLGARIGSREWWRGAVTLVALCWSMIHFAPGLAPLAAASDPAPSDPAIADAEWQQARALAIAPLAYGADTGRRMAAGDLVEPLIGAPERPRLDVAATLGLGDGFARVLERAGVGSDEARAAAALVGRQVPLGAIAPGTRIAMTLGQRPRAGADRPLAYLRFRAGFDLRLALTRIDGALRLAREPIPVDTTPLRVTGLVGGGLYRAARDNGAPGAAIAAYLKAISTRLDLDRDIGADDRFDMVVARRRAATGEVETGALLYAGLQQPRGKGVQLLRWTGDGRDDWYTAAGTGETRGEMRMPVDGGRETSGFGMRFHPILGFSRMHMGVDFGAPAGAPIYAATGGTVTFAGWHGGHGNFVQIFEGKALGTGYAHMSRIAVAPGEHVTRGQIIGYVGSTGLSTGPHLHYEVYRDGLPVDPMSVRFDTAAQLAGDALARFRATLARLLAVKPDARAFPTLRSAATGAAAPRG